MNNNENMNNNLNSAQNQTISNINTEEVMEEALSHTNQYTPFEVPKQEIIETPKQENPKSSYILIIVILIIMALFIIFLPQISKLFGW